MQDTHKQKKTLNLKKFHDVCVESTTMNFETLESSTFGKVLKLFLCSLFPTWIMSQHDHINVNHTFCCQACVWCHWKNAFCHNHFSIFRKCLIAVLQKFQAVLITPIMTNPLHVYKNISSIITLCFEVYQM